LGESGWSVHGTPWWTGSPQAAPLRRLLWLVRHETPGLRHAEPAEVVRALLTQSRRYVPQAEVLGRIGLACTELAVSAVLRVAAGEGQVALAVQEAMEC